MLQFVVLWARQACRARRGWRIGEVRRGTFSHPRRAFRQCSVGHRVHERAPQRALEHAALTQHPQRRQLNLLTDECPELKGRPSSCPLELLGGLMEADPHASRRDSERVCQRLTLACRQRCERRTLSRIGRGHDDDEVGWNGRRR